MLQQKKGIAHHQTASAALKKLEGQLILLTTN